MERQLERKLASARRWAAALLAWPALAWADGASQAQKSQGAQQGAASAQQQRETKEQQRGVPPQRRLGAAWAGTPLDVQELNRRAERYAGQKVAVAGEIQDRVGGASFVLESGGIVNDEILVAVRKDAQGLEPSELAEDTDVVVTGTLRRVPVIEIERELGWDLEPELEIELEETKSVLVAERIERQR